MKMLLLKDSLLQLYSTLKNKIKISKKTTIDKKLISLINDLFSYRRKTVKNILKQFNKQSTIEKRIDDLSGDEIVNLAKQILKK